MFRKDAVQFVFIRAQEDGREITTSFDAVEYTVELIENALSNQTKNFIRSKVQEKLEEEKERKIEAAKTLLEDNDYEVKKL